MTQTTTSTQTPTTDSKIEVYEARDPKHNKLYTKEELISIVDTCISGIQIYIDINTRTLGKVHTGLASKDDLYYTMSGLKGDLKRCGSRMLYEHKALTEAYRTSWQQQHNTNVAYTMVTESTVLASLDNLNYAMERCNEFKSRLLKGSLKSGHWFAGIRQRAHSYDGQKYNEVYTVSIPDVVECDICKRTIVAHNINIHKNTASCKDAGRRKDLERRGFKYVSNNTSLHRAIAAGKIQGCELIPIDYNIWAPSWMLDAADKFEKELEHSNKKSRKGYAGLTLEEFIAKMTLDNTTES